MPEARKRRAGSGGHAPRRPKKAGAKAASGATRRRRRKGSKWAIDVHLTAPGRGKGDTAHRIEKQEPFEVLGLLWPMEGSDPVEVDLVIEDLRAQVLIPEHALPRLRKAFRLPATREGRAGMRDAARKPRPALKPERVQARKRGK